MLREKNYDTGKTYLHQKRFIHADSTRILYNTAHLSKSKIRKRILIKAKTNEKRYKPMKVISFLTGSIPISCDVNFKGDVLERNIYASANAETAKRHDTRKC